ncbi:MAG TPA: O-antigen translocase [Bacteroidales bacterium]|nr:O-antigen translocase [Bacteroidales bacterium]
MAKDRNSYISIIKATSLFGGVKILQIIISIIRSKFIAVLLGPTGMGIAGLISSSTDIISSLTGFGLRTSGIREVSQAYSTGDDLRKNTTITVLRKLVLLTGITGTILTFLLSSHLSEWAFGNKDYSLAFKMVSIILLFNQINIGQMVLLQGTYRYKDIAKSTLYGSILGLILTVPLYYLWGIDGIVPAIIIASLIQLLLSWYYTRKISYKKINLTIKQSFSEGKVMLTLGIAIAATGFATQGTAYLVRVFISNYGSIADVGLYTAGIAIATTYVGLVLNAMSTDYSPRLASVANNGKDLIKVINKQAVLLVTTLAPLIILFIVFIKQVVIILYSNKFIEITGMIEWVMLGMFFRAISWSISFSFVARGDSRIFFLNELVANVYSISLSVIGYILFGLVGLGMAFLFSYTLYTIQMYLVAKKRFLFSFNADFRAIFIPQIILTFLCFVITKIVGYNAYRYIVGILFVTITLWISYKRLSKMIDIPLVIENIKNRITHK